MIFRGEEQSNHKVGVGSKFKRNGELYVLANIGQRTLALININGGFLWANPVSVENVYWITRSEWEKIINVTFTPNPQVFISLGDCRFKPED